MTVRTTMKSVLLGALIVALALALYAGGSLLKTGGIWIPAEGYGAGDGYWLAVAPDQATPQHGHMKNGSFVLAAKGSTGTLRDRNGRDDVWSTICDDHRNFRDAMAVVRRVDANGNTERGKFRKHFDGNGIGRGCGHDFNVGFSGERHSAAENADYGGWSGESNHKGN